MPELHPAAKAIAAGLVTVLGSLLLFVTGDETLADVTVAEWIAVGVNTIGAYGIVWVVPNKEN